MKRMLVLLFPVILIMSLIGCSKKSDNTTVGPEGQGTSSGLYKSELEGIYKSDGIVSWAGDDLDVTWNFSGENLTWDLTSYKKETPESQFAFDYQASSGYSFKTDNSFLIIDPPVVNRYMKIGTMYFHYKLEGTKLTLSPGRIYTGNSNNLTGTVWELKLSPGINAVPVKYIYKEDKTGYLITGGPDTTRFTYTVEGNTISHEYTHYGRKYSFKATYEIKNNKLYFLDIQSEGKSEFEYENLGALALFKSSAPTATKDYFPLVKGNRWWFGYYFAPEVSYGSTYTSGILSWEIVSVSEPDANKAVKYNVRETFQGYKIPSFMSKDTVFIGPDTAYFNITEDAYHRLRINSQLTALGQVSFNRYYSESTPDTIRVSTHNYSNHEITLMRNKGIEEWILGMSSNGDLSGVLRTINRVLVIK